MLLQIRRKLFYGEVGLSKNVGQHGWLMTKNIKTTLAKMTENFPRMLDQKINGSKPHDWILARSYFLRERLKTKENWQKNTHFTMQFCSKNLTHLTNLNSLIIVKKYTPVTLNKFSSKHVSGVCHKKYLHCTIFKRPKTTFSKHLEIKWLYIPVNPCKEVFVPET